MLSSTTFLFLIASFVMTAHSRTINGPDQFIPLLFSSVNQDETNAMPSSDGQNRMIPVITQIIKYVSSIKSSENFIENLVGRQREVADKIKVLTFLNKCFEITHDVIQQEIDRMIGMPTTGQTAVKKSSSLSSSFTLEELQQVQGKVNDVLASIEKRMANLKAWIPPTMPFLGFF
ncbi:hypothetical protein I4U23_010206 [Adineta vaga]|nr:hypothetical protein I4U23_010206 [Adineta vaga]